MNQLTTLLASLIQNDRVIAFFGNTYDVSLNWIGKLIRMLIEGVGIVGVGVILFSVILKLIVLPFDIYQRVNMSKQNLKMAENKERLERLQKQYANDKATYNQKMMEMYKENGISVFSSCLPMILSIVIFIVAINAFTAFSSYANLQSYNQLVKGYNESLISRTAVLEEQNTNYDSENNCWIVYEEKKEIFFKVDESELSEAYVGDDWETLKPLLEEANKQYYVNVEYVYGEYQAEIDEVLGDEENALSKNEVCVQYVISLIQEDVRSLYNSEVKDQTSFLWVKNVWTTDASYKHPIMSYSDFKSTMQKAKLLTDDGKISFSKAAETKPYNAESYNIVTGGLSKEKSAPNGFYIMVVLSIGTILLQQWITMRMQKEQNKYSSVDGQGAMNPKTMMIVMTVMFAIFSFMYSAAFSIYMITSNLLSLVTTVIINKIVSVKMEKKAQQKLQEKYDRRFYQKRNQQGQNKGKK